MTDDQRFAARRPDVLVYQTSPLAEDVTLAGPLKAELFVATSGTDADWVVKVIDVFPPGTPGGPGAINDWITNNFYTLDAESEKGIIAAMLPLDNYLADLNSGQAWYRPSYLIVAVLKRERVASQVQGALERTYNQFYRHQLLYDHATMNCTRCAGTTLSTT